MKKLNNILILIFLFALSLLVTACDKKTSEKKTKNSTSISTQAESKKVTQKATTEKTEAKTEAHKHSLTHHEAVEGTCTSKGTIEYWSCDGCKKNFSDANGVVEVTNLESDYKHSYVKHDKVSATYENAGNIEYYTCEKCDKVFDSEYNEIAISDTVVDMLKFYPENREYDVFNAFEDVSSVDNYFFNTSEVSNNYAIDGNSYNLKIVGKAVCTKLPIIMKKNGTILSETKWNDYEYFQMSIYATDEATFYILNKGYELEAGYNIIKITKSQMIEQLSSNTECYDYTKGYFWCQVSGEDTELYLDELIAVLPEGKEKTIDFYPEDQEYVVLQDFETGADSSVDTWFIAGSDSSTEHAISGKSFHIVAENASWSKVPVMIKNDGHILTKAEWERYEYFMISIYADSACSFGFLNKIYSLSVGVNYIKISGTDMMAQINSNAECYPANGWFWCQLNGTNISIYLDELIAVLPEGVCAKHTLTHVDAVPGSDCEHKGTIEYYSCSVCGCDFIDENGYTEVESYEGAYGAHTLTHVDAVAGTDCEHKGTIEYYSCSVCKKNFADEECTTEVTSLEAEFGAHNYDFINGTWTWTEDTINGGFTAQYSYKCTVCDDEIKVDATVTHESQSATCMVKGDTTYTAKVIVNEIEYTDTKVVEGEYGQHVYDDGIVTTEPGCETKGVKTYTCLTEGCEHQKTEEIAAKGHSYIKVDAVAATLEKAGNIEYYTCSGCEKIFILSNEEYIEATLDEVTIPKIDYYPVGRAYDVLQDFETGANSSVDTWFIAGSDSSTEHAISGKSFHIVAENASWSKVPVMIKKNNQILSIDDWGAYEYFMISIYADNACTFAFLNKAYSLATGKNYITISGTDMLTQINSNAECYPANGWFWCQLNGTNVSIYLDEFIGVYPEGKDQSSAYYPYGRLYDVLQDFETGANSSVDTWFISGSDSSTEHAISGKSFHIVAENASWSKVPVMIKKNNAILTTADWEAYEYFKISIYADSACTFGFLNQVYSLTPGFNYIKINGTDMIAQINSNAECYPANGWFWCQLNGTNVSIYLDEFIGVYPADYLASKFAPEGKSVDVLQSFDADGCIDTYFVSGSALSNEYAISGNSFHVVKDTADWTALPMMVKLNSNTLTADDWNKYEYYMISVYATNACTFTFCNKVFDLTSGYNFLTISKADMDAQLQNSACYNSTSGWFLLQLNGSNIDIYLDQFIGVYTETE